MYIGYNKATGQVGFLVITTETKPVGVTLADTFDIMNNNIVAGDIFVVFIHNQDDGTIATFELTIKENGVYPAFPALQASDFKLEQRILMVENGFVKMPADVITKVVFGSSFAGPTYEFLASDFSGSLFTKTAPPTFVGPSTYTFTNPSMILSYPVQFPGFVLGFYNLNNAAPLLNNMTSIYFKGGSFKTSANTATLHEGYPVFDSDPDIFNNPLSVAIGDFSASLETSGGFGYLISDPSSPYTKASLLFTNNQSIPQDVVVKLVEGSTQYTAKRVDEFNYLVQGEFKAAVGQYSLQISQNDQLVLKMPINYLTMYLSTPSPVYYFNQILLNQKFSTPKPSGSEETVLLVFKKKNVGKTADVCTLSTLNVSVNGTQVFSEQTTNCTINVKIDKSKVIQGFDLEWVWTQEGAIISEGKQKLTARVVSDALTADGFELTTKFMNQSYTTGGEVAAIVVGSIAALFVVGIIITCIFTNCKCFKAPRFQNNVYQM